jgi:hypothetical protein
MRCHHLGSCKARFGRAPRCLKHLPFRCLCFSPASQPCQHTQTLCRTVGGTHLTQVRSRSAGRWTSVRAVAVVVAALAAAATVAATVAATAVATAVATVAVLEAAVLVPEAAVLQVAVQVLEVVVQVAAVPVLEVPVLAAPVTVAATAVQVLEVPVQVLAVLLEEAVAVAVLEVAVPVQGRPGWAAAQVEPLQPAWAMAHRVPVSVEAAVETAPLGALARRVQSVHRTLPVLPASALPQAVAHPMGRRRMARPRVRQGQDRRAMGAGRGAA